MSSIILYQGRLTEGGAAANGLFDLEFRLFGLPAGGPQVGATVITQDLAVVNGLFAVQLDFGSSVYDGSDLWLQVGVRPGVSNGVFTVLMPRQPLRATPYALYANRAASASQVAFSNVLGAPVYSAGLGLSLDPANQFNVSFGGDGLSNLVARSDHTHIGESWSGATARGLQVVSTLAGGTNFGLWGQTESTSGRGVMGLAAANSGTNYGVYGQARGGRGAGVLGESTHTNGTGVHARGAGGTSTALAIGNGGVRVIGAGLGTTTPVFVHRAVTTNILYGSLTAIHHPLCNHDPNAILIITPNFNPGDAGGTNGVHNLNPLGVFYTGTSTLYAPHTNRWAIYNQSGAFMPAGSAYNVLVVKP